jgi:hypothetical protein
LTEKRGNPVNNLKILKMKIRPFILILLTSSLFFFSCEYHPEKIRELKGQWKFSIGDNNEWANPGFNDKFWDRVYVPSSWEDQGYRGYNGFAWYRRHVTISKRYEKTSLYLFIGKIDDVDEVYFNGKLIGSSGTFPPDYKGAWEIQRRYPIPHNLINFSGENVIAVRVYDGHDLGGIRGGKFGIYRSDVIPLDVDLSGVWKFQLNDSTIWKNEDFNDADWKTINVPEHWEDQGYEDYDGYAWYRRKFDMPSQLIDQKLVMVAGKIDDIDEVYINGKLIGHTGVFETDSDEPETYGYYDEFRGYYLPDDFKLKEKGNVIAIRVYDSRGGGGIYEGPIGIVTQDNYTKFWRNNKRRFR